MNEWTEWSRELARVAWIGIGATAVLDVWLAALRRMGVTTQPLALIGRWVGHMARGRWCHDGIAKSAPVRGEGALGWLMHYATGVCFAALLVLVTGRNWAAQPTVLPALAAGIATVAAPLLVMQPAMGSGVAASRTATPWRNRLRSVANHAVFGAGLYLAAWAGSRAFPG
ncbi:DUF2938 domain-containing protein [Acidovorax sp. sic0104]|uniref:DUF2938 domain-containing protein n=1 Tax=Acidovorax sp. sic0104 TaxID=2854784 RepID=UPI001C472E35|nr:DUF2938 domain-containing protein [Acidovorax sp. sic0104]MBV7540474.1 DUF2938 domain-containing protein [Acidovorax sp. sic0104]